MATSPYDLGLSRREIIDFFGFIDQVLRLSRPQEKKFRLRLQQFEKERKMRYITSIERLGREEGREESREEGRKEVARRMLAEGFSLEQIQRITEAPPEQLEKWLGSEET